MNRLSRLVQAPRVLNIEDLRRRAKGRLPRVVFDYIDGGAEHESTLRENCRAFEAVTLRPRCAVATPVCHLRATVLGTSISMPLILAPVGSCRLMFPRGEEAAARSAGFSALVVTIDTPVAGFRERDLRNGAKELLSGKLGPMLPFVSQLLVRPRWLAALLADGGLMKFENVVIPGKGPMLYADVTAALEQSVVTWEDLKWICAAWNGPVVIKGVHTREDALRVVDEGADALVVSNHRGRQLDRVAPSLEVLPEVAAAV